MNRNQPIESSRGVQIRTRIHAGPMQLNSRPVLEIRRVPGDSERPSAEEESEAAPRPDTSNRLDWNMVALWLFVVICFGALAFALYVIWSKCHGDSQGSYVVRLAAMVPPPSLLGVTESVRSRVQ